MVHKRTLHVFYDLLSGNSSLARIQKLFEGEGIFENEKYASNLGGQRRALADTYVASLNLNNSHDARKLLNVFEIFYLELEEDEDFLEGKDWRQFLKLLERDGYEFSDGKIQYTNSTFITSEIEGYTSEYSIEHVENDWKRALNQAKTDPEDAITASLSMIESTLKWILDEKGENYKKGDSLNQLYKQVFQLLNMAPDQHSEGIFKQILGSISGVVTGLGSLRNEFGDSHGKGRNNTKPSERHAKFAINLSGTMCIYLIETFQKE
ncbi:abortive infection family protein [Aureibacillus halotolerans]|uniref:Abortive infection Abi-like protein n=1 Tax=Aureibacillus halotolerans TaxID=1508390 RepID=A0A4R6U2Z9_9BACI|nr:abortive infection family protein [Aureibacillus halotolerans]TDQ37484.1 abortive infection Abi-like protein [Aureibacillus halotolerans]